jgi:hypothetical protein
VRQPGVVGWMPSSSRIITEFGPVEGFPQHNSPRVVNTWTVVSQRR